MLKELKPRLYQESIFASCTTKNCLVVLPTGMGKTLISLLLSSHRLKQYPSSKILLLSPTKPLVEQHYQTFKKYFAIPEEKLAMFTGSTKPELRAKLWQEKQIIFSTPQGLENDILSSRVNLNDVSLLVFDEAHRATGDYAYVFLAKQYEKQSRFPKILALTASPGSDLQKITEICSNLRIEEVEIRTEKDPDVAPYIQDVKISWVEVLLPEELKIIKRFLELSYKSKLKELQNFGTIKTLDLNKTALLGLQGQLHAQIAQGDREITTLKSISLLAEAMKVQHALELLETQGTTALNSYFKKLQGDSIKTKVKAVQNLMRDPQFKAAMFKTNQATENNIEHPKLEKLKDLIQKKELHTKSSKALIFCQFRDSGKKIVEELNTLPGISAKLFVGQAKKGGTGLSQKKQVEMLNEFRNDEFNILVATSVAEEGLDIPNVDLVLFYEPIPSAIRHIQRRGRTGRLAGGEVTILMTKGTRDEGYRWSAHHKQNRMHRILDNLRSKLKTTLVAQATQPSQTNLSSFAEKPSNKNPSSQTSKNLIIFADYREKGSPVLKQLLNAGINLRLEKLNAADFLISSRVGVEFKRVPDFVDSIIDGRLLDQLKSLKQNFERPLIIVEGIEDIYAQRKIHPHAIQGMIATITVSYGIPLIQTKNPIETASFLKVLAKREQVEQDSSFTPHAEKRILSTKEQQEYLISSLPGIGLSTAKDLLKQFKTPLDILTAPIEDLKKTPQVGPKKAQALRDVLDKEYE